ncbi:putative ribonuclease H-like domain-containing protein [Tanacetum coccineum]
MTDRVKAVSAVRGIRETADNPQRALKNKRIIDSGCSRHMTRNKAYLAEYQDYNGGPVAFGGSKGYITGKGKIKTGKLDFEDVCFVKELQHFNLFFVSQMCDKKNKVLFTNTKCLVLSSDFKLPDENQVLLRIPRQNNMYSFNLENIVPSGGLACLIAKATIDESNKWHRRLGHVNFKNLNKLVKGNLVRGLPSKIFQNDHTCVACQKGKQHKASCKAKSVSSISQPLQLLHMDLFGPTSVRSINHKTYCLVITDDFSRFSWVFFLRTKDETSGILKDFIRQIENQLNQKVKTIRCDNGTEFKNRDIIEFCHTKEPKRDPTIGCDGAFIEWSIPPECTDPIFLSSCQDFHRLWLSNSATKDVKHAVAIASAQKNKGSLEAESIVRAASTRRSVDNAESFTYHRYCSELGLINLCFADDLFLFAHGDSDSVKVIKEALDEFKVASGLIPSLPKSKGYFCNVLNCNKLAILQILPFEEGTLPVKYLGVPLVTSRLVFRDCKELIEKVQARVDDWKNKFLSAAGRLQLIRSVLSSMHIYWASMFILPSRVLLDIEQIIRHFLWSHGSSKRCQSKVAWEVVCLPKDEGGLGVRRLDTFNKALMVSHMWKLLSLKESLWVRWVHIYKLNNRNFWDVLIRGNISWGWRKVLQLRPFGF